MFCGEFCEMGQLIRSRALDDRLGVAVLIELLKDDSLPRFTGVFSVGEEVGARGAKTAAFSTKPDGAIILEATTASDVPDVPLQKQVCRLGEGPAVSFMDKWTVYDSRLYQYAINRGLKCQPKAAVVGGNNSGSVQLSGSGVPVIALSVPCRYIHSPSCTANLEDVESMRLLAAKMIKAMACSEII